MKLNVCKGWLVSRLTYSMNQMLRLCNINMTVQEGHQCWLRKGPRKYGSQPCFKVLSNIHPEKGRKTSVRIISIWTKIQSLHFQIRSKLSGFLTAQMIPATIQLWICWSQTKHINRQFKWKVHQLLCNDQNVMQPIRNVNTKSFKAVQRIWNR